MIDIIPPLAPKDPREWTCHGDIGKIIRSPYSVICYDNQHRALRVLSAVEVAKDTDGIDRGPEYHISITRQTGRGAAMCSADEARWVLEQFGLDGAEEDNHTPGGVARNFWRPVADRLVGIECACKETENTEVIGDFVRRPLP